MAGLPKRIVTVAPHFEEYALRLATALAEQADVLLILDTGVLDAEFIGRERPAHPRLTIGHNRFRTLRELVRLITEIRRFRPDVLHWQEPSGFIKAAFAAATLTLARGRMRTAITIHDPVPHAGRDWRVAARLAWLRRYARRRVDRLFLHGPACVAQYQHDYLGTATPDPRVRLTEHGVLLPPDTPTALPATFRALMFGRMEAYKGLETLTRALEILADQGRAVAVEVAGTGPELDRLEERLHALPDVTVSNGFVPAARLGERIAAASCILLPYTEASQSGVLAAAFANGRFAIVTAVGGLIDLAEDGVNALLIPANDPEALAAALTRAAGDAALRQRLSAGACHTARTRLDWSSIAARLLSDY